MFDRKANRLPNPSLADQSPGELTDREFEAFRKIVYEHSGICLSTDKKNLVRARVGKRLRAGRFQSFGDYLSHVVNDASGEELINLIDSISTNLTFFFREVKHFDLLREKVLPAMMVRKKSRGERRFRLWSAGCSSGEEPYSLVMTCLPVLEPLSAWDFKLLASDISTKVLTKAKLGIYSRDQVQKMNSLQVSEFFDQRGGQLVVKNNIKSFITFSRINLLENFPFKGPFDVIFCRNVMIYFDRATQEQLVQRFWNYLAPEGHLFIGHSENLMQLSHRFQYVCPAVYRK